MSVLVVAQSSSEIPEGLMKTLYKNLSQTQPYIYFKISVYLVHVRYVFQSFMVISRLATTEKISTQLRVASLLMTTQGCNM